MGSQSSPFGNWWRGREKKGGKGIGGHARDTVGPIGWLATRNKSQSHGSIATKTPTSPTISKRKKKNHVRRYLVGHDLDDLDGALGGGIAVDVRHLDFDHMELAHAAVLTRRAIVVVTDVVEQDVRVVLVVGATIAV